MLLQAGDLALEFVAGDAGVLGVLVGFQLALLELYLEAGVLLAQDRLQLGFDVLVGLLEDAAAGWSICIVASSIVPRTLMMVDRRPRLLITLIHRLPQILIRRPVRKRRPVRTHALCNDLGAVEL